MNKNIISESIRDNETWNTCVKCLKNWKDRIATPGLLHRTKVCYDCRKNKTKKK